MNNRWVHTIAGLIAGFGLPLFVGMMISAMRGVHLSTFLWNVFHRVPFYNSFYQLGIAVNIGVFFLIMKQDRAIYLGRGFLVATILSALWTVIIEL